jgi:hypothetical protein
MSKGIEKNNRINLRIRRNDFMKSLATLKMNLKKRNAPPRSRLLRLTQMYAVTILGLLLLSSCLFGGEAAASDFHLHIKDHKTGDSFFINALNGDYMLFRGANRSYLAGRGKLTVSDCLLELRDSGASAKRPDREVYIAYNLCEGTAKAEGQVFATGETFALLGSHTTEQLAGDITAKDAQDANAEPGTNIRFEPKCMQDDVQSHLQVNFEDASPGSGFIFADRQKNVFAKGMGTAVVNGCKLTITGSGPDPKRPDYRIIVEYNRCTFAASAFIWIAASGKTYQLTDSDIRNSNNCLF